MKVGPLHLLSLLNLALAGGLASLWLDPNAQPLSSLHWQAPPAVKPEIGLPALAVKSDPQKGNPQAYASILARPVFAPDRRPPPPPAPPVPPPPPPPPDPFASVQIQGLFTGQNGGVLARVEGKMRRVKIGQTIGAWTLQAVEGREATFKQGEEERKLALAYARLNTPVAAPPPPRPAQQPSPVSAPQAAPQDQTEAQRERLRRRNELRIKNGLPPLNE